MQKSRSRMITDLFKKLGQPTILTIVKLVFFSFFICNKGRSSNIFDRYTGIIHLEKLGIRQYAKLDFVTLRNEHNRLRIIAIFTIYFGKFGSDEYISYHYDDVEYNLVTGTLTFSQDDQDLTLQSTEFTRDRLTAVVRSGAAGRIGSIKLFKQNHAPAKEIVLPSLEGSYQSKCKNKVQTLSLQTYRSTSDTIRIGNPFGAYKIKGQFATPNEILCYSKKPCVTNQIVEGSYNFLNGKLTLQGLQGTKRCERATSGNIKCGDCVYEKTSQPDCRDIQIARGPFPKFPNDDNYGLRYLQEGAYQGYLFHEHRQVYQHMAFDILSYRKHRENKFVLSAVANLYFGEYNSNEILTYRFEDLPVNILNDEFVLERTERDVDAILKVTGVGPGIIKGEWYSIIFGKVGDFYAKLTEAPVLELPPETLQPLSRQYQSNEKSLRLDVLLGQTPVNTENPFYPLILTGFFAYNKGISSRLLVTGGSYDFYTGKIGFELEDGHRVVSGHIRGKKMKLHWSSKGFATIMQDFSAQIFHSQ